MKKNTYNKYSPAEIELKWQSIWQNEKIYQPDLNSARNSFYNLMMFPYPSAEGLHIGGVRTFVGVDIYSRYMRMKGHDVFMPFGLDGFGIHAENYALKIGENPMTHAAVTEKNFYRQIKEEAIGVDWSRVVETYDKKYYKWTQWLFTQLFKNGLAYRKKSAVNFCPSCKTVLADEQVIDEKCERCSSVVEKKNLEQWFFRITKYADRLLANIPDLNWTEKVKIAQRNWIGKSEGARIEFGIENSESKIEVFTTAIDTIYGMTFLVISPEHPLVDKILKLVQDDKQRKEIGNYIDYAKSKSDMDRMSEGKEKTGVPTGVFVTNPFNDEKVPIWIADYVLMGYGTGAVMAVPAHDSRDHEFASKYDLPIKPVVKPDKDTTETTVEEDGFWDYPEIKTKFAEKSVLFNSGEFDGLTSKEAKQKMLDFIKEKGIGDRTTTYHLRDWLISRQRYWGPPIPMIYCENCAKESTGEQKEMPGWYAVPEKDLPIELPFIEDFKPLGTGVSPLANHPEFYEVACPECGSAARRETDVSDTFLDSAWYFFRYTSTEFDDRPFDRERVKKWLPVDMYIGGAEHSVLHLLYARFITMFLKDAGFIDFDEPFSRFYAHGLILKEGAKMSKSKGNVVGPDVYTKKFGADTLRMYLHFLAPFNQDGNFRDEGIEGMHRFLKKVWKLFQESGISIRQAQDKRNQESGLSGEELRVMHETIKGVTEDMENLRFNTAIAKLMTWYNFLFKQESVSQEEMEVYLKLLAPFAPHMTEELFQKLFRNQEFVSIHIQDWPRYDEKYLVADMVKIPVQVNGKLRGMLEAPAIDIENQEKVVEMAKKDEKVEKFLEGKTIKQAIYVNGKVLNFVV